MIKQGGLEINNKYKYQKRKKREPMADLRILGRRGISMMELMVTIAIITVLVSMGFASFREFKTSYELNNATKRLYSDLLWCQQKAMGAPHGFGVRFEEHKYYLFEDKNDNLQYDNGEELLEKGLNRLTLSGYPSGGFVMFSRRGIPYQQFTVTIENQKNQRRQITISLFKIRSE